MDDILGNDQKNETNAENAKYQISTGTDDDCIGLKRAYIIYQQASKRIKDIKFIIELLNVAKERKKTEKLQDKIVR